MYFYSILSEARGGEGPAQAFRVCSEKPVKTGTLSSYLAAVSPQISNNTVRPKVNKIIADNPDL